MQYKVVYLPDVINRGGEREIASKIEKVINDLALEGWRYQRLDLLTAWAKSTNGCFGFGAQTGYNTYVHMLIFNKD